MNIDELIEKASCNCFAQAEAFFSMFVDMGNPKKNVRNLKESAAIKVLVATDESPYTISGHAFVIVLQKGHNVICQSFFDDLIPFDKTDTLSNEDARDLIQAIQQPWKDSEQTIVRFIPQLEEMFDKTDAVKIRLECITW